jgi:hypothetical protein
MSRHQRIAPYMPRHNGKVERYNRILAEEFLYARGWHSEEERSTKVRNVPQEFDELTSARIRSRRSERRAGRNRRSILG